MLGCTAEELNSLDTFHRLTLPEDRANDEELHRAVREGRSQGYRQEKRDVRSDVGTSGRMPRPSRAISRSYKRGSTTSPMTSGAFRINCTRLYWSTPA
jgi:hypothetical protein